MWTWEIGGAISACSMRRAEVVERGDFRTTPAGLKRMLVGHSGATVAFETGSHALWMSREVEAAGCRALEANPRRVHHGNIRFHSASDELLSEGDSPT